MASAAKAKGARSERPFFDAMTALYEFAPPVIAVTPRRFWA
jgi:hypothetical protein